MNRKYLLRGIGIGLVIGSLVTYTAFKTGDYDSAGSKEQTVTEQQTDTTATEKETEKVTEAPTTEKETEKITEAPTEKETEKVTEAPTSEDITEEPTEAPTSEDPTEEPTEAPTEEPTSEKKTEEPTEAPTEPPKSEEPTEEPTEEPAAVTRQITVTAGMSSDKIAKLVQDAGIIENYLDFDAWLSRKGYDRILRVGTFTLKTGMSYEEIAKVLTTKQ